VLPDAHTDFIFAVIAEEYGTLACLVILGLFALVAVRVFSRQAASPDGFARLCGIGLALLFSLQAAINMAVNVGLVPAKGITLPFISSGGSSTLGVGLAMGMLLALTRRRPDLAHVKKPGFAPRRAGLGTTGSWRL
jgi:cell division protein FtsW